MAGKSSQTRAGPSTPSSGRGRGPGNSNPVATPSYHQQAGSQEKAGDAVPRDVSDVTPGSTASSLSANGASSVPVTPAQVHNANLKVATSGIEKLDVSGGSPKEGRAVVVVAHGDDQADHSSLSEDDSDVSSLMIETEDDDFEVRLNKWDLHKVSKSSSPDDPFVASSDSSLNSPAPRKDRDLKNVTAENAQGVFAPTSCAFVANQPDAKLVTALYELFSEYGKVYIKVKRDGNGMPFSFAQFETIAACREAIEHGRGRLIYGRPIRTERAKCNRSLYLSRIVGGRPSVDDTRDLLSQYGAIESMWYSSNTDREMFRLPDGIWVQFAYFDDARDAAGAFKNNIKWRLEQPSLPDDLRATWTKRKGNGMTLTPGRNGHAQARTSPTSAGGGRDRKTISVGNIPSTASIRDMWYLFGGFGRILSTNMVFRHDDPNGEIYALVEFDRAGVTDNILAAEPFSLHGFRLIIQRRNTTHARNGFTLGGQCFGTGSPSRQTNGFEDGFSLSLSGTMSPFTGQASNVVVPTNPGFPMQQHFASQMAVGSHVQSSPAGNVMYNGPVPAHFHPGGNVPNGPYQSPLPQPQFGVMPPAFACEAAQGGNQETVGGDLATLNEETQ